LASEQRDRYRVPGGTQWAAPSQRRVLSCMCCTQSCLEAKSFWMEDRGCTWLHAGVLWLWSSWIAVEYLVGLSGQRNGRGGPRVTQAAHRNRCHATGFPIRARGCHALEGVPAQWTHARSGIHPLLQQLVCGKITLNLAFLCSESASMGIVSCMLRHAEYSVVSCVSDKHPFKRCSDVRLPPCIMTHIPAAQLHLATLSAERCFSNHVGSPIASPQQSSGEMIILAGFGKTVHEG